MTHTPAHRRPVATRDEAVLLINGLIASLDELGAVLDQESEELRQGRLKQAMALSASKNEASKRYILMLQAANSNASALKALAPDHLENFKTIHAEFDGRLNQNLAVLATAQALSDNLVQEIAAAVARSDKPVAYTARGATTEARTATTTRPISLSRSL